MFCEVQHFVLLQLLLPILYGFIYALYFPFWGGVGRQRRRDCVHTSLALVSVRSQHVYIWFTSSRTHSI